jgi:hypothetical protein
MRPGTQDQPEPRVLPRQHRQLWFDCFVHSWGIDRFVGSTSPQEFSWIYFRERNGCPHTQSKLQKTSLGSILFSASKKYWLVVIWFCFVFSLLYFIMLSLTIFPQPWWYSRLNSGLVIARLALSRLNHPRVLLLLVHFSDRASSFCLGYSQTMILLPLPPKQQVL